MIIYACRHFILNVKSSDMTESKKLRNQNINFSFKEVQVGKDQEKAQSEKDSHSKNRGGKKPN